MPYPLPLCTFSARVILPSFTLKGYASYLRFPVTFGDGERVQVNKGSAYPYTPLFTPYFTSSPAVPFGDLPYSEAKETKGHRR